MQILLHSYLFVLFVVMLCFYSKQQHQHRATFGFPWKFAVSIKNTMSQIFINYVPVLHITCMFMNMILERFHHFTCIIILYSKNMYV